MTLVELLTAELIGGVVITAAIMLVVISFNGSQRVSDRANSLSQGRTLAAQMEQRINSQICMYGGEYAINGTTIYDRSAASIVYASRDKLIYFADLGGSTGTGSLSPRLRTLYYDPGASGATSTGRLGTFVDGINSPTTSAVPFNFTLPVNSVELMGIPANGSAFSPATSRKIVGSGVTSVVSGGTTKPFFEYYTPVSPTGVTETPISFNGSGAIPTTELGAISHVRVNFKILAESGNDTAKQNSSTLDDRTADFRSDVYFRTTPSICG